MNDFKQYIQSSKKLLIVGGAPSANKGSIEWYKQFDVIVRCNNYKKVNSYRTDIFSSYFGRNIKKTKEELITDGVKYLLCKYPNADMSLELKDYNIKDKDYRWVYELRKNWWFKPVVSLTKDNLLEQINLLDGFMPTVGISTILFLLKLKTPIYIIGFDCFKSDIHNLNEKWDRSGNHNIEGEELLLNLLEKSKKIIWKK